MLRKLLLSISMAFCGALVVNAQSGIKVTVTDQATGEAVPFATIFVEGEGQKKGAVADINGEAVVKPLAPGKYNVRVTQVGLPEQNIKDVAVSTDRISYLDVKMGTTVLETVVVYDKPLIGKNITSGGTLTGKEFGRLATKDVTAAAATSAGIFTQDAGSAASIRGSRTNGTQYIVDDMKIVGNGSLGYTQQNIAEISVITGGLPARFGDATGGVISVTTKGAPNKFFAAVQGETSQYLDAFGHNLLGFSLGGPLVSKRDSSGNNNSIIGYVLSGELSYKKDPDPSSTGVYKVKDDVLKSLETNPLRPAAIGTGFLRNAEFVTMDDLQKIKYRQNVAQRGVTLNGKVQFKLAENTDITVGGAYTYRNAHAFVYEYALFNPQNNPQVIDNNWRTYVRLQQRFNTGKEGKGEKESLITNAYYVLQAEYSRNKTVTQDDTHKDNYFDYGYIGKFTQKRAPYYEFDINKQAYVLRLYYDSLLTFTPSDLNQTGANYTSQFFNYSQAAGIPVTTGSQVQQGLGLWNGDRPTNAYSLWFNTGRQYGGYDLANTDQFRVFTSFSADINKKHSVQVGFEYEQRIISGFNVNQSIGLWTLMRQLSNRHLSQLDTSSYTVSTQGPYNYYTYNNKYDGASQSQFDKSLRQKLGLAVNDPRWLDIDSYDPSTFSLSMFSADDLLNNGGSYVGYYGYDYTGKKLKSSPSFDQFFTKKDANGNFTREMAALQPIYIAGYIQDQFDIRDLKFRLGVRIDRFDANQKVLKDKYLLYPAKTAAEVNNLGAHPSTVGSDYVVYVNDLKNPSAILGYRDGDRWFNSQGTEVSDPSVLTQGSSTTTGKLVPYLVDPNSTAISGAVFKDFKPQLNVMPRIAFAFPINDDAQFNANYDVTTQRPEGGTNLALPTDYLFWPTATSPFLANPNLQPERTTAYEIGFTQVLNEKKNAALTISAFYKEMRNMIQVRNVVSAYPQTYMSYSNLDFGTVKGFSVGIDIRRTNNAQLSGNYTLQFADGTGSSASDGFNLISAGLPNLRSTIPLSYDRRHTFNILFDYRFGEKADYKGPTVKVKKGGEEKVIQVLKNVGANITLKGGSGTPFSRQSNVVQEAATGIQGRSSLKGSVNGSNMPWFFRVDLKIDKDIVIQWSKSEGEGQGKTSTLNVYFLMLNALNTKNILSVYRYTGNAGDDGYLNATLAQNNIAAQTNVQSFKDLYSIKVNNPGYYSIPRSIRVGFVLNFN